MTISSVHMTNRTLGSTRLDVSPVGFGAAEIGFLDVPEREVHELLNDVLDAGINVIDTAAGYQKSEQLIGNAIGRRRDEFVLISKVGRSGSDADDVWSKESLSKTIDNALQMLQTERIDVMLLHSCSQGVLERGEALEALLDAKEAGKIAHAGYSGDNEAAAYAVTLDGVEALETSINIVDQRNIELVLPPARAQNIGVIVKRPIANAAWKNLSTQPGMYQNYARTYSERFAAMGLRAADLGIAEDAWPEIALRFTLSQPGVHTAIIGTTNPKHMRSNIQAAAKGGLDPEVMAHISAAFSQADRSAGGDWVAQT